MRQTRPVEHRLAALTSPQRVSRQRISVTARTIISLSVPQSATRCNQAATTPASAPVVPDKSMTTSNIAAADTTAIATTTTTTAITSSASTSQATQTTTTGRPARPVERRLSRLSQLPSSGSIFTSVYLVTFLCLLFVYPTRVSPSSNWQQSSQTKAHTPDYLSSSQSRSSSQGKFRSAATRSSHDDQHSGRGQTPEPAGQCNDCLAIPLVSLVGDRQVNGFLIPRRYRLGGARNHHQLVNERPSISESTYLGYASNEHAPGAPWPDSYHSVPTTDGHYARNLHARPTSGHPSLFQPKSDDKCPMTGPMTVCDQIGSYPADVILSKLDKARQALRQSSTRSYFNLDSLFSDERDHSSEPFDSGGKAVKSRWSSRNGSAGNTTAHSALAESRKHRPTRERVAGRNLTPSAYDGRERDGYGGHSKSHGEQLHAGFRQTALDQRHKHSRRHQSGNANIDPQTAVNYKKSTKTAIGNGRNHHGERGAAVDDTDTGLSAEHHYCNQAAGVRQLHVHRNQARLADLTSNRRESIRLNRSAGRALYSPSEQTDEFVDLVERRAVSIARPDPVEVASGAGRHPRATQAVADQKQPTPNSGPADEYLPSDDSSVDSSNSFELNSPALISNSTLTNTIELDGGEFSSTHSRYIPQASANTDPEHSMGNGGTENVDGLQDDNFASASISVVSTSKATGASASTELRQSANSASSRRSRRQVSVQVSSGSVENAMGQPSVGRLTATNQEESTERPISGPEDPDISPDEGSGRVEPICRVKSIYITPRAALNDKKEWKYVVNAPEKNPRIKQIIRVDICVDPFGPCSDQVSIPFGFTSQCKQKYSKKKLLAVDPSSGLLGVDIFFIPSCCVCQLIRDRVDDEPTTTPVPESEDP